MKNEKGKMRNEKGATQVGSGKYCVFGRLRRSKFFIFHFSFFLFFFASSHAHSQLCISELLYQPRSGEAEYVELYNNSNSAINLSDYHIVRWLNDEPSTHYFLPDITLQPHSYVALSKDIASVAAIYTIERPSALVECNLPTYPNSGGSVLLALVDSTVVDRLDYTPDMHSELLRNKAGVSLERRSFGRPTNEPSNWFSASSTSGYGTPGYANSQSSEFLAKETDFVLSSAIVSPDGDGYQDMLTVEYALERGDLMGDAALFDATGLRVAQLLNSALLGTHGSFEWTPDNTLPRGRYVLTIILYDTHGTRQQIRQTVSIIR